LRGGEEEKNDPGTVVNEGGGGEINPPKSEIISGPFEVTGEGKGKKKTARAANGHLNLGESLANLSLA